MFKFYSKIDQFWLTLIRNKLYCIADLTYYYIVRNNGNYIFKNLSDILIIYIMLNPCLKYPFVIN